MSIEVFFKQIKHTRDLAAANGTGHTEAQCNPRAEHTWENFVLYFTEAHQELTELQMAAQQGR
eukprot:4683868-Ditylum_brightwellii.AAC.1